jgi:hypothetical protein
VYAYYYLGRTVIKVLNRITYTNSVSQLFAAFCSACLRHTACAPIATWAAPSSTAVIPQDNTHCRSMLTYRVCAYYYLGRIAVKVLNSITHSNPVC